MREARFKSRDEKKINKQRYFHIVLTLLQTAVVAVDKIRFVRLCVLELQKFRRRVQESTQVLRELEISLRTNHIG